MGKLSSNMFLCGRPVCKNLGGDAAATKRNKQSHRCGAANQQTRTRGHQRGVSNWFVRLRSGETLHCPRRCRNRYLSVASRSPHLDVDDAELQEEDTHQGKSVGTEPARKLTFMLSYKTVSLEQGMQGEHVVTVWMGRSSILYIKPVPLLGCLPSPSTLSTTHLVCASFSWLASGNAVRPCASTGKRRF